MPSTNTANDKGQNQRPAWETNGSMANVIMSSDSGTTFPGQQSRAEPQVLAIGTATTMTSPPLANHSLYGSRTQASNNRFESYRVCFEKRHSTSYFPNISSKQKNRQMYHRRFNLRSSQPQVSVTHGEPPPAYSDMR